MPPLVASPKKIKVFVVDTGISKLPEFLPYLSKENNPYDLNDAHGHGTHITGLILFGSTLKDAVCNEVEVISCRFFGGTHEVSTSECFERAVAMNADVINVSAGGQGFDRSEYMALKKFKGDIVAAAGNSEYDPKTHKLVKAAWDISKEPYYPAALPLRNITVVGNGTSSDDRAQSSNYGFPGMVWRDGRNVLSFAPIAGKDRMTGTSQAAAIYTHEIVQAKCQRLRSAK